MACQKCIKIGVLAAIVSIVLDQVSKWWVLDVMGIATNPPIEVTPFLNMAMVWNRGVSFGMLSNSESWMPLALIGLALIITGVMVRWLWQCKERFQALAIGLIIGGAVGNIIDRARFGAVADFIDVHAMGYHWPAFNIADSAIFLGVAWMLYDGLVGKRGEA